MAFKIRSIRFNFIMNIILTGSSVLLPLITFPFVSRTLQAGAYGACGFAIAVVNWFSLIAMLGVNRYGIREVAKVRDDPRKLARTTKEILAVTCISTAIVYVCFIISLFLIPRFSESRMLLFINGFTILCNTLGVAWFFQGIEQYSYITIRSIIIKLICFIGVILLVHTPDDYLIYAALVVLSAALANLVNFFYSFHILRATQEEAGLDPKRGPDSPPLDLRKHVKPLFIFFLIVAAISIYTVLDTVMLGFMSDDVQVGYYTADVGVKNGLAGLISALAGVLLPRASNMLAQNKRSDYIGVIRKAVRYVLIVAIPISVIGFFVATPVIAWYGGADFAGAGDALSVIVIAVVPIGLSVIFCDNVMVPLGMERRCTVIYICAAAADIVLNIFLIPPFGAVGAAIATTIVEFGITIVEFIIVRPYIWGNALKDYKIPEIEPAVPTNPGV